MSLPEHVVFDLETNADGSDPSTHEIIQIGAVLASATGVLDTFETLVRPQRRLSARITELTGLEHGALEHAPHVADALRRFFGWVGDRPMIAHNGLGYDFAVLDAAAGAIGLATPVGPRLDTLELAHIVYPRAGKGMVRGVDGKHPPPGRTLDQMAELADLAARDKHDALQDARMARRVMLHLLAELNAPDPARQLQRWVLGRGRHPWAQFVEPQRRPVALDTVVPEVPLPDAIVPTGRCDINKIVESFREGGSLMTPGREPRPAQAEMAELVARTFSKPGQRRMIEAPTGTGKTLAYLVPAIEAARASGRVSVVAPHSRVLQDQILATLEDLKSTLEPFTSVVLKGRHNYISLKALQAELDSLADKLDAGLPDDGSALALAILCGWVAQTPSGDWADLRTGAIERRVYDLRRLRWRLRVDARPGPAHDRVDELDFYRRALERLKTAHVAVLNHALLAAGPMPEAGELNLLVDEAHNLEDSVTAAASKAIGVNEINMLCDALWDPSMSRGLLRRIAAAGGTGADTPPVERLRDALMSVRAATVGVTEPLIEHVRDRTGATREEAARYGVAHRIVRGVDRRHQTYQRVEEEGRALRDALQEVAEALEEIDLSPMLTGRIRTAALEDEKARLGREARNAAKLVDAVLWAQPQLHLIDDDLDDDLAQWINIAEVRFEATSPEVARPLDRGPGVATQSTEGRGAGPADHESDVSGHWRWVLRRVPLSVAGLLNDLWQHSSSVVLTSATLRAGDDFSFLSGRLGLKGVTPTSIASPWKDLGDRHLLVLTDYLPAPRGQLLDRFTETAAAEIPRLCVAADGGALALFAARSRLERVRDHARPALGACGIDLLAQGEGPSAALVERKRTEPSSCLLGLRSFWEGIDIPGDALRLLLVEKIPFDSMGDPIVSARMGLLEMHGKDPFADYLVPRAAIMFAQGNGRLIRTETDRGVTVVLDNRLCRPLPYVDTMLGGLVGPPTTRRVGKREDAYREVAEHLDLEMDEARQERIALIPGVTALSQAALDVGGDVADLNGDEIERRLEVAKEWLGFDEWRPGQLDVMRRLMRGEDVVAVLPTGSGKSVTYQIPALLSPGVTVVVSPLIALMRDQVDNLRARGVSEVAAIYSGVGQAEQHAVLRSAAQGDIKLLYVSPERLWSPTFRAGLADVDVTRIAVDEAHCISLWGHSFRPEYALIPQAVKAASGGGVRVPVAAVTATATREVLDDMARLLEIRTGEDPMVGSVDRPEIRYYVEHCRDRGDRDLRVVQVMDAFRRRSAVVYVPTRNDTVRLTGLLRSFGHRVRPYSGAMELGERQHTEDAFRHGEIDVVVATKAFGLGIDKPDIELIVHLEMPATIEEYVQETGRAARGARDGTGPETGTAVLLTMPGDCRIHKHFVESSAPDIATVRDVWNGLRDRVSLVDPEAERARTAEGESDESRSLALHYLVQVGAARRHQDFVLEGRIATVDSTDSRLERLRVSQPELARKADELLRLARREHGWYRGQRWAQQLHESVGDVERTLIELSNLGICSFSTRRLGWVFERLADAEPDWDRVKGLIDKRLAAVQQRAKQARAFAHNSPRCRRRVMLRYLGESDPAQGDPWVCGTCDSCTPDLHRPWKGLEIAYEDAADAQREQAEAVALILIDDVEAGRWSRLNLERTLLGRSGGAHPLRERLRSHGCYGRLSLLTQQGVQRLVDELIAEGCVEQYTPAERDYESLRLTDEGRSRRRNRYPR